MFRKFRAARTAGLSALLAMLAMAAVPAASQAGAALSQRSLVAAKAEARLAGDGAAEPALPAGALDALPEPATAAHLMTYDARTGAAKDPVNVVFAGAASPWDVNYDLENWTRTPWVPARGARQAVFDAGVWRPDAYQLKPVGAGEYPEPRMHVRLFATGAQTAADAHRDLPAHLCGGDWQAAGEELVASFEDANGDPLWFVSAIYRVSGAGPAPGQVQCGYYDGDTVVIVLRS